jgi:predicted 2-oxoglutarate/Fe(II)-dependent dioxygenase YbiX
MLNSLFDAGTDPVAPGNRAPSCHGMSPDRAFYSFEEQYGRAAVLILAGAEAADRLTPILGDFAAALDRFAACSADVFLLVDDNPAALLGTALDACPVRVIDGGNFLARCGVGARDILVLVLDRNLRIAMRSDPAAEPAIASACLACLDRLPHEAPREISMPAPAIILPNLITGALCRELIALFESSPTIDGAVARIDASGRQSSVVDHGKKRRRDMMIEPGTGLHHTLRDALLGRCRPEIAKAFQGRVAYTDRILVSRYDDTGGWFRRHRDNAADNVAFREFALSVNLNTDEYDGGHLLFPEYNDHRYQPPAGAGLIFSTAVLHEAAPVTRGSRYVLLTFFHGEAAEACRLAQLGQAAATAA